MVEKLYRVGDNYPPIAKHAIHKDDQSDYDLTGFIGTWYMRKIGETTNKASGTIIITDYTGGYFECRWGDNDLDTVGKYWMAFKPSSGSSIMTLPHIDDEETIIKVVAGI